MESLIFYVLLAVVFFIIGWKAREYHAVRMMNILISRATEESYNEFKSNMIDVRVEAHEDQLFVYRKDDGTYLAHADTKRDIEIMLMQKFPGKLFNASQEDLQKLNSK
jgi:hypothetical protein